MWKCSKCETVNDGELCSVCGEPRGEELEIDEEVVDTATVDSAEDSEIETEEVVDAATVDSSEDSEIETEETVDIADADEVNDAEEAFVSSSDYPSENGDDIEENNAKKPMSKKTITAIAVILIFALLIGAFAIYKYNKGNDEKTMDEDVAMIVNDIEVPVEVFNSYLAVRALYYQQDYCYGEDGSFDVTKLDDFDWDDVADKETGETHKDKVIKLTVDDCIKTYSLIALARKNDIKPTEEEKAQIDEYINQLKEGYGSNFDTILKANGYDSLDTFREVLSIDLEINAISADMKENPDKYINKDHSVYNFKDPEQISAKHILIMIDEENGVDDAAAKAKAEEVLGKINAGEDFDALIAQYNEDPGQPAEGYTFGEGRMVKEFETAAFALKADEVSGLVKTSFGYHIIKRIVGSSDIIQYEREKAKVTKNKDFIKNCKITSDYKKLMEVEEKAQQEAMEAAQAEAAAAAAAQAEAETTVEAVPVE